VMHIHPFQTATTGRNARLSDFFSQTGLEVSSSKIQLPTDPALGDNSGKTFKKGDKCPDGQKGVIKTLVWEDAAGSAAPKVFVADIPRIRYTNNGMAFAFAFVPEDQDVSTIPKPPSAARLEELGAADSGAATSPTDTSNASTSVPASVPASTAAASAPPTTGG
jgi:hypothetical protein